MKNTLTCEPSLLQDEYDFQTVYDLNNFGRMHMRGDMEKEI